MNSLDPGNKEQGNYISPLNRFRRLNGPQQVTIISAVALCILVLIVALAAFMIARNKVINDEPYFILTEEAFEGLEVITTGECGELYQITDLNEEYGVGCTHGPEVPITQDDVVAEDSEPNSNVLGTQVQCDGDGVSGLRVQFVYAHAEDVESSYEENLERFKQLASEVDYIFNESAKKTGGTARVRWVTNENCEVDVVQVKMSAEGDDSFGRTVNELRRAGYEDPNKIYTVFTDADLVCGVAWALYDEEPNPLLNRSSNGTTVKFNRIDRKCWQPRVVAHELVHNLGAVNHGAPHSDGGGHCHDGPDVMCGIASEGVVGCAREHRYLLDCNSDDYFHANPEAGTYLHGHWNVFDSLYLITSLSNAEEPEEDEEEAAPPPTAYEVTSYDVFQDSFKLSWKLPSTEGIAFTNVEVDGATKVSLSGAQTSAWVNSFTFAPGQTYSARVVTVGVDGQRSYSAKISLSTLETPVQEPGSVVPYDVKIVSVDGGSAVITAKIDRLPSDDPYTYQALTNITPEWSSVSPNNDSSSSPLTIYKTEKGRTFTFNVAGGAPQEVEYYFIRVKRFGAGTVVDSEKVYTNFNGAPETNKPLPPSNFRAVPFTNNPNSIDFRYDKSPRDDSGQVRYYKFSTTGPGGYFHSYYKPHYNQDLDVSYNPTGFTSDTTALTPGDYTISAQSIDIWGNVSDPYVNVYTIP